MSISLIKKNQTIGIVVPARKVDKDQLLKGCEVIKSWGLNVKMGKYCNQDAGVYLAASDEERMHDFQMMLDDDAVDAIFCARGGYGTTRILDRLDFTKFMNRPKWIVGFSDITAIHLKLYKLGVESIHACMSLQFPKPEYMASANALRKLLMDGNGKELQADRHGNNRLGNSSGQVVGGNLSLVVDSLGTSTAPETDGKILVLEEVDELLYKIDRMLTQLKRAGKLSNLAGLVIGHMTDLKDTELPFNQNIEEIILDKVSSYSFPVAFGFPIGHEAPNYPWVHGGQATLSVTSSRSTLTFK